jgi:SAM-dependent methyltransferase
MLRLVWYLLEKNWAYKAFRNWVGPEEFIQYIVQRWQRAEPGMAVLDLGCGTGDALLRLPEVKYEGHDMNADYIRMATERFGERGRFVVTDLATTEVPNVGEFDLALLFGVLHHLDDAACQRLLRMAHKALKPGGRLITLDGVFHKGQGWLSRWVVARDRGRFVRDEEAYLALARSVFPVVNHEVCEGRIRIPYSHLIMECVR